MVHFQAIQTRFHMKCFWRRLVLKQRHSEMALWNLTSYYWPPYWISFQIFVFQKETITLKRGGEKGLGFSIAGGRGSTPYKDGDSVSRAPEISLNFATLLSSEVSEKHTKLGNFKMPMFVSGLKRRLSFSRSLYREFSSLRLPRAERRSEMADFKLEIKFFR